VQANRKVQIYRQAGRKVLAGYQETPPSLKLDLHITWHVSIPEKEPASKKFT
jgi:hypothetical protein